MRFHSIIWAALVALCASVAAAAPILNTPYVLVSDYQFGRVQRYTPQGQFIDTFASALGLAGEMARGPDGNIYISDFGQDRITKLNGLTGASMGFFVNGGTLYNPRGLAFGADGNLYVTAGIENESKPGAIQKYNGVTGAFMGNFASGTSLDHPTGLTFGPDGDLYVAFDTRYTTPRADSVKRFDGITGAYVATVATSGIDIPQDVIFGPGGSMYVTNQGSGNVTRYLNGTPQGVFASGVGNGQGMAFFSDGNLYVATGGSTVQRRNGTTGAATGDFVSTNMNFALDILYVPEPASAGAAMGVGVVLFHRRRRGPRRAI